MHVIKVIKRIKHKEAIQFLGTKKSYEKIIKWINNRWIQDFPEEKLIYDNIKNEITLGDGEEIFNIEKSDWFIDNDIHPDILELFGSSVEIITDEEFNKKYQII